MSVHFQNIALKIFFDGRELVNLFRKLADLDVLVFDLCSQNVVVVDRLIVHFLELLELVDFLLRYVKLYFCFIKISLHLSQIIFVLLISDIKLHTILDKTVYLLSILFYFLQLTLVDRFDFIKCFDMIFHQL